MSSAMLSKAIATTKPKLQASPVRAEISDAASSTRISGFARPGDLARPRPARWVLQLVRAMTAQPRGGLA
jgi:hypothetical protein